MFYTNKYLFFAVLLILSAVLAYFIDQKIILLGIFENLFFLTLFIFAAVAAVSFITAVGAVIIIKILVSLIYRMLAKSEERYNSFFVFWLSFTFFAYIAVLGVFMVSITY